MSLTTGAISPGANIGSYAYRSPISQATNSNLFTSTYESSYGPTRENAAQKQHQSDIKELASEIAAKETPEAQVERDEMGYFAKSAAEKSLQAKKDELQKKIDDNALEVAVKADPYFLLAKQWDRYVIMAANGETVTLEMEDTSGKTNADGSYPKKTIEITKSKRLRKIATAATPKKPTKTPASIRNEYSEKEAAVLKKYEKKWEDSEGLTGFKLSCTGRFRAGSEKDYNAYNKEISNLSLQCEQAIAALANQADTIPPSQGKNVEPHTIAIYAPGYCMEKGCCLEKAFYTLRAACKAIEENAEAEAKNLLKDMYTRRKELQDAASECAAAVDEEHDKALDIAYEKAVEAYREAYAESNKVVVINGKAIRTSSKPPDKKAYHAAVWLEEHPEIYDETNYQTVIDEQMAADEELNVFDDELNDKLEETIATFNNDAKNYRLLLDHCTFQPTCPEWLEDAGSAIASGAAAVGSAIASGARAAGEYAWKGAVATGEFLSDSISFVSGAVNDSLAFLGDLQDQLNELVGFEGLCSLNPFGGTLGCRNCPMGSDCNAQKSGLLDKIAAATAENTFLNNLNRALGLGQGQLLGNMLRCAAALTGEMSGVISSVANFSINKGMSSVLGVTGSVLNTSALPNFNTKVMDCIGNTTQLSEAKSAIDLLNRTSRGPMSVLQSNTSGLSGVCPIDLSKIDKANTTTNYFTSSVLGADRSNILSMAKNQVDFELPSGSTQYYDGKNVDNDAVSRAQKEAEANGLYDYVDPAEQMEKQRQMLEGIPGGSEIDSQALMLMA